MQFRKATSCGAEADQDSAVELSAEEVRNGVVAVVLRDYGQTVPEFLEAVESGRLQKDTYVREVLAWLSTLPTADPIRQPANKTCPA